MAIGMASFAIKSETLNPLSSAVLAIVSKGTFINIAKINEIKLNPRLSPKMTSIEYCCINNKPKNGPMAAPSTILKLKS